MPAPLILPSRTGSNRGLWTDSVVDDVIRKLHYGDPTAGWEGDERLSLWLVEGDVWELWRVEEDGREVIVCRSKPGEDIQGLIPFLVQHDMRRSRNPFDLNKFIADADRAQEDAANEQAAIAAEALAEVYDRIQE